MLKEKEKQNSLNEVRLLASIEDENIVAYKVKQRSIIFFKGSIH
jgi:hypothetical protein